MWLTNCYPSLTNKVVLITGGATGIGAHLVEAFCCQGAQVIFLDIQSDEANLLIERLESNSKATTPTFIYCDLLKVSDLQSVIAEAGQRFGDISVLINNAANDTRHDFRTVTEEEWNNRVNVNLRHVFFAIQAVCPQMKRLGGGSVINFGSRSWYECQGNMIGYATSKSGIEGLTRSLAKDLGQDNIRINTLIPGWVTTPKQLRELINEETAEYIQHSQCIKGALVPEDICAMALFLASDDSRMCTSQHFVVDGGWIFNPY